MQDDTISRRFEKIVVEYPTICTYPEYQGKPYFSIQYEENGEHIVGYGTYKPEVLTRYIKEYFMPSVTQKSGKWTPVSERSPERNKRVLVCYETMEGLKVDTSIFDKYGCLVGKAVAWMPLPEPYETQESEDKE